MQAYRLLIRPGFTVLDIGANIGAHTLHFARLVGMEGRVFAFEPTSFALTKLRLNLSLNPDLAGCVSAEQYFLVGDRLASPPPSIPSSWPVAERSRDPHEALYGRGQASDGAAAITADDFCLNEGVTRVDFVKLDVDGYEYAVLRGLQQSWSASGP